MYTALIATRFTGDGLSTATAFRPKFADDYPGVAWEDVCGIPSARLAALVKNVYIVRVTFPDSMAATLTAAAADSNLVVLWNERVDDTDGHVVSGNRQSTLTGPQLAAIKSFLTARGYVAGDLSGVSLPITREDATTALVNLFRNAS
jgi:hypothetical protein